MGPRRSARLYTAAAASASRAGNPLSSGAFRQGKGIVMATTPPPDVPKPSQPEPPAPPPPEIVPPGPDVDVPEPAPPIDDPAPVNPVSAV